MTKLLVLALSVNCRASLPQPVKGQGRKAYELWRTNLQHPNLNRIHKTEPLYSLRVSCDRRALGRAGDTVTWFRIGQHAAYDLLL